MWRAEATHEEVALESIKILALESKGSLEVNGDFRQAALMKIFISIKIFFDGEFN